MAVDLHQKHFVVQLVAATATHESNRREKTGYRERFLMPTRSLEYLT